MPVISTNLAANSAVRYLNINSASQTSSLSKLASGSRITQASDDAAGLAISTKIASDVTALNQAATNASHGISVLQTADGGASNISDILQRMKALASQSASGTVTDNERVYIDAEFQQLIQEVDAISSGTRYNGQSLLNGSSAFADGINVMVGSDAADTIKIALDWLTSQGLGLNTSAGVQKAGVDGSPAEPAKAATLTGDGAAIWGATTFNGEKVFIGSETIFLADNTFYSRDDLATYLTAQSTVWDVTVDSSDRFVFTQKAGTEGAIGATPTLTTDSTPWNAANMGITTSTFVDGVDAIPQGTDVVASLTGGSTGTTISELTRFNINGTTVKLTETGGDGNGVYTTQQLVDTINAALLADNNTSVVATVVSGALTLTSADAGDKAAIVLDVFTSGSASSILGITTGTAIAATEQSTKTQADAVTALGVIDTAISTVSKARASIGSLESRFGFHQASIATSVENLTAAVSAIKDTDVAQEAAKLASSKVKTQAAVAAAAQASQMPQDLLKLLQ